MVNLMTKWGARAAALYGAEYAARYREADDRIRHGPLVQRFGEWLHDVCLGFGRPITVIDLGCGTGRYFGSLANVSRLVGVDVSADMLREAQRPVDAAAVDMQRVTLIQADLLTVPLAPAEFDLAYSIGVLGEHTPLAPRISDKVFSALRPGGVFAFTGVHVGSFSVPRTATRRAAEWLAAPGWSPLAKPIGRRLLAGGLYVDEPYLRRVLERSGFCVDSIQRHQSEVHLHCLTVARKPA
jgi:SAM-dependent methyltransferase